MSNFGTWRDQTLTTEARLKLYTSAIEIAIWKGLDDLGRGDRSLVQIGQDFYLDPEDVERRIRAAMQRVNEL